MTAAIALLWNLRRIGTRWQAKNVPCASDVVVSRASLVGRRLASTIIALTILDIMTSAPPPDPAMVGLENQSLSGMGCMSPACLAFRVIGTVSFWLSTALINLVMANTVTLLSVLAGWTLPTVCPPLYGDLLESYSIRNFWGITGHADLATHYMSPKEQHQLASRYLRLWAAFAISGLVHHSSDLAMGVASSDAGALKFFLLQPIGIMLEDGIQALARHGSIPKFIRLMVGYFWVLLFLSWSTPTWFYPQQRLGIRSEDLLPIHVCTYWKIILPL
ncbi:hypothetical protein PFICI_10197 [Pestalotiopsis fici W106-1]|uniref:Wax synthase domain-containing protein n=1 Tax=Pestalotiopsis fici (strain W106-1 / CGMCC3.15140) TaxID=1229662 RepID=W3WWA9_PESFW|nr:uncharacterized protein PFICI_10197 [Pestalotiopsis fici W106-1]ETS78135.1 hypothetical protein PFICI_10197 [Pestalotiopsis fici W106-1]